MTAPKAGPTPGPWKAVRYTGEVTVEAPCGRVIYFAAVQSDENAVADAHLIAAAPDHALFGAAACAGKARWEPWASLPTDANSGEVCVGGMRYSTRLDEFGMPVLHDPLREALAKAVQP